MAEAGEGPARGGIPGIKVIYVRMENPGTKNGSSGDADSEPGAKWRNERDMRWWLVGRSNSAGRGQYTVSVPTLLPLICFQKNVYLPA